MRMTMVPSGSDAARWQSLFLVLVLVYVHGFRYSHESFMSRDDKTRNQRPGLFLQNHCYCHGMLLCVVFVRRVVLPMIFLWLSGTGSRRDR